QNLGLNLPFALAFLLTASAGWPTPRNLVLIVVAFVAARNAGHSFNRYADRDVDARNPRTASRLLVAHPAASRYALAFAAANAAILVVCAALLSGLALALVPVAILLVLGYSYTKRFTSLTTVFLGLVEAITPAAVYAGVTDTLPPAAWLAVGALLAWGTAFETIHSLGDRASDAALGLRSLPVAIGERRSTELLVGAHGIALALFASYGWIAGLRPGFYLGLAAMAAGTAWTDRWVLRDPTASRRPFEMHFVLSALFLAAVLLGLFGPSL
ncbi:MAG: UbiA family prenyltransferase, partial [Thermoplasmata archaeon]|nr:UbiA family prenyltransferase [Thermoplasmata archaeon]